MFEKVKNLGMKTKTGIITCAIIGGNTLVALCAEGDDVATKAITDGFASAGKSIAVIVGLGVTATVSVIAMSGGAKAGLKWIKGVFSKAS